MITHIHSFINQHNLIPAGSTIVLGISGGPDSVFLLHVLAPLANQGSIKLIAAYLNHGWPANSDQELLFSQRLSQSLNIPFVSTHIDNLNITFKFNGSKEENGRRYRRFFLEQVAREHSATHIALAHHADDQQETFFIRLLRGTTLTGLTGMKLKQGMYVRPLLATYKADILTYLQTYNVPYMTDPTNHEAVFMRNKIRLLALPALKQCDPRFNQNFASSLAHLQETEAFLDELANKTLNDLTVSGTFEIKQWTALHPFLQKKVIVQWLYTHKLPLQLTSPFIEEVIRFLTSPTGGTHILHPTWALVKKQGKVWVEKD